ncbi:AraC family transcriptional regulator [Comamonas endophytica]|uniref:AraC family transcriptional regulator n=1 Tax=Comamonas endophytica TaxID=2949090 RepID=A0ABY6GEX0_9BURK|nr:MULTISPECIES: AraC family transcriptional regulator [unclassified Acidovorax]MCD2512779.1 AraC family transcriptional regulator [Acidovorax sp. D4N7]UYG52870.1 AraC family transcriptional regulator [Acidovorax sp. 5MLIR]
MSTPALVRASQPLATHAAGGHPALTPMAFVQAIVQAYAQRGLSAEAALQKAQIAPERVALAEARITAMQMEVLSDAAMRELDDEALGWFGRRLPWGSYGMLARASISSASLGLALARWCRHHGLLADDIALELQTHGDTAELAISEQRPLGAMREFCLVSVLRNIHGLASWLIDARLPLLEAGFPFAPPAHADAYTVLFPVAAPTGVRFGADRAHLRFDARFLALPLARDEAALQQMLQRALPLTVRPYRRDRPLAQRVRRLLVADAQSLHTAATLAEQLHLSARSLHRQLKDEGSSLQALKDQVRRERALALLQRTQQPIKRVALACGFASEKSFMRAFRQWTGDTPAQYRRRSNALPE